MLFVYLMTLQRKSIKRQFSSRVANHYQNMLQKTDNNIKLIFRHFRVTHVWSCCWFIIILERKWRYDFLHSLQIKHFSILDYRELKINEWTSALRSFFRFAIEIQHSDFLLGFLIWIYNIDLGLRFGIGIQDLGMGIICDRTEWNKHNWNLK